MIKIKTVSIDSAPCVLIPPSKGVRRRGKDTRRQDLTQQAFSLLCSCDAHYELRRALTWRTEIGF